MATYAELHALQGNNSSVVPLYDKIQVALIIRANALAKLANPTAAQKAFASAALANPSSYQQTVLNYILADYQAANVTQILNASDAQVQAAVDSAVNTLLSV